MSQVYTARRRTAQDHTQAAAPAAQGRQAAPGLGVDAQAFGMGSRLEELMQERMRQHFLDHQIPEAEREADRLASAAQGGPHSGGGQDQDGRAAGRGLLRRPLPHGFRRLPHR